MTSVSDGVRINPDNEVVSDAVKLLSTGVTSVSEGVTVSVIMTSLVSDGVGVGVNSRNVVVSDRTRLVNSGVNGGVVMEGEGVSISLLVIMKSSLVGVGDGVGVRVTSGKEVVSDTEKLLTVGVSSATLVEGVNANVVSV